MRLRVSYKLFEALKLKRESCSLSPVSTVDDFLGVSSLFQIIFWISFSHQTCSQLLNRLLVETFTVYAFVFPANAFGFSRLISKSYMLVKRAPKSSWRAPGRALGYFSKKFWKLFESDAFDANVSSNVFSVAFTCLKEFENVGSMDRVQHLGQIMNVICKIHGIFWFQCSNFKGF